MDLVTHIRALNAVQLAWVAEDPANRGAGLLVENVEFWASMGVTTVEGFDRYMLVGEYSDAHKEAHGFRPRRDLTALSNVQIEAELVVLRKLALEVEWVEPMDFGDLLSHNQRELDDAEREEEKEAAANRAWEEKWGVHYERLGV